ncbi:MAG TPA: serine/threonine-protein kinase, partial [Polyangiaceae bacterium]|nr:serine/threonine-protein kinase [Polyangiaceae bacterium]
KLLHATSTDPRQQAEARGRLLREAQALARLSHPNVVAAYDVGTHEGALFITMEFIEGTSMRDWLAQPRHPAEVLRVLIAAGRGLVAAHASAVLHRDFKPANVMVSSDGRVRIVDFGLAQASNQATTAPPPAEHDGRRRPTTRQPWPGTGTRPVPAFAAASSPDTITRTASLAGTPGYMPPEQWLGGTLDHRMDQFGYAVTAFVALTGQKPYPDVLEPSLLPALSRARTPWPRSVPRALRRIVERGLSPSPEQRYPSMAAMVNALERFSSAKKRGGARLALGAALGACVALTGAIPNALSSDTFCKVDDAPLRGVWDPVQRVRVEQAFLASGNKNAGEAFHLVSQRLDLFRDQWLEMRRDSCEATLVRARQPERVMVLRATCLDRALEGTKAMVEALAKVDAASMNRSAGAATPSLAGCEDTAALLGSADQLPADPALRARIDEVEVGLVVNQALVEARGPEAVEHAQHILELARATGHVAAEAKATAQLGRARLRVATNREQRAAGEALLNDSLRLAALAGDVQLSARSASFLFYSIANADTRVLEGDAMLPLVEAAVARAGNPPLPLIEFLYSQNTALVRRNKVDEASALLEQTIRLAEANVGTEFQRLAAAASGELGHVYAHMKRFADAEASGRRSVDGMRRLFGSHHPQMMTPLANLAVLQSRAQHLDLALETMAEYRALADSLPPDEPRRVWVPLMESRIWFNTGHCDRAVPLQREALARFTASRGPDHALTTNVMSELGQCLAAIDQIPEGLSWLERTVANRRAASDDALPDAQLALAKALWKVPAKRVQARATAEEARAYWVAEGSPIRIEEADEWLGAHPL